MNDADERKLRDQRVEAFTVIGCSIAVLRRLDYIPLDDTVRDAITRVRATLSVAQSTIKDQIDGSVTTKTEDET